MSKFCRFWLQLSLIYNAIIAVESLFSQAWMMLGIAAISLWCLTLLMQGRLLGLRLYWTMCATIFLINVLNHVDLSFNLLNLIDHDLSGHAQPPGFPIDKTPFRLRQELGKR